jgi:hypothetical protein
MNHCKGAMHVYMATCTFVQVLTIDFIAQIHVKCFK